MAKAPTTKKVKPDWEKIEADYRAGVKTLRQIAEENGISHVAVNKRAKRDGWERDLSKKIKAKADALVTKSAVTSSVTKATEQEVVTANAEMRAAVQLAHRRDIPKKRELVDRLFAELSDITDNGELIEQVSSALAANDWKSLATSIQKVCSWPSRVKGVNDLVSAYKSLIAMERQAFNIDDRTNPGEDIEEITITFRKAEHGEN